MKKLLLALFLLTTSCMWGQTASCQIGSNTGTSTVVASFASQGAGTLVIVSARENSDSTSTWTITDSAGQTYTQTASGYIDDASTNNRMDVRWTANSANITSVTANFGVAKATTTILVCFISGAVTSTPEDTSTNSFLSGFVTTINSNSGGSTFTTTHASDMLIYVVGMSGGTTSPVVDTGYTLGAYSGNRHALEWKTVSSTQTGQFTTLSWTSSAHAEGVFVAIKLTAAASPGHGMVIY